MTYKINRTAIIDGDIIAYTAACWAQAQNIDDENLCGRVENETLRWASEAMCNKFIVAFSCSRDKNYRRTLWADYKLHRADKPTPPGLLTAKTHMRFHFSCIEAPHIEADDFLGILGSRPILKDGSIPVMVTIDKDLRQVPGWHFNPDKEDHPVRITEEEGNRFFHKQWIMGDATDNIPGLWKWGPAKADQLLEGLSGAEMTQAVLQAYQDHPKGYPVEYAYVMAQCVRILRAGDYDALSQAVKLWHPPGHPLPPAPPEAMPAPVVPDPEPVETPAVTIVLTTAPKANKAKSPKSPKKAKATPTKA